MGQVGEVALVALGAVALAGVRIAVGLRARATTHGRHGCVGLRRMS